MKLEIVKMDHLGSGIGYIDEKIVFVPFTVPGDLVKIDILKETNNYIIGKLIKIIKPSEDRIKPFCKYYLDCGGCNLQNYTYEKTSEYKKARIKNILKRNNYDGEIIFIENKYPINYRNKITLKVKEGKIGFYKTKSHTLVEIEECKITKECINNFLKEIKDMNITSGDITIRCNYNDELLVSIKSEDNITLKEDYSSYKVVGIIINDKCIYGFNSFMDKIENFFFEVAYNSFFQINNYINSKLFEIIKENTNKDVVLDLYSGVGTLSIMASEKAKKVYGIEYIENAIFNALKNMKINNKENINFILGTVEEKLPLIKNKINTIIIDPPRKGLEKSVINNILDLNASKIIYISCENQKLTEDLKKLESNYTIKKVYALDMFSYSYHTEVVCILERI